MLLVGVAVNGSKDMSGKVKLTVAYARNRQFQDGIS